MRAVKYRYPGGCVIRVASDCAEKPVQSDSADCDHVFRWYRMNRPAEKDHPSTLKRNGQDDQKHRDTSQHLECGKEKYYRHNRKLIDINDEQHEEAQKLTDITGTKTVRLFFSFPGAAFCTRFLTPARITLQACQKTAADQKQ